jgi:hypothetical protein
VFLGTTALCEPAADPGPAPTAEELKSYTALAQKGVLVQPLAAGINWRYVNFRGAEKVDASVFALLKGAVTTVDLDLTGQKLTDADAAALSSLTNLKKLSLARSTITDAGLAALKPLQKLESLNLFGTEISDAGLNHLTTLKSLKRLYVFQTKTTEAGVGKLKAHALGSLMTMLWGSKTTTNTNELTSHNVKQLVHGDAMRSVEMGLAGGRENATQTRRKLRIMIRIVARAATCTSTSSSASLLQLPPRGTPPLHSRLTCIV